MNLLDIRQEFIEKTGRTDLATTSTGSSENYDVDAGADFYIKAAIRTLDRMQENSSSEAYFSANLAVGASEVKVIDCRNISQVWIVTTDGQTKLEWMNYEELMTEYPKLTTTTSGTPEYWSSYNKVLSPRQRFSGDDYGNRTVVVMPPTNAAVEVQVYGKFYSSDLVDNVDENFWSVVHPDILIMAAMQEVEGFYRNTEGYADFERIVQKKLRGIDVDLASIDAADAIEMEG